jgi:hypothetical protein
MNILSSFLVCILLLSTSTKASFNRRRLGGRKLVEATDPSSVLEGQYIVIFEQRVANVTAKVAQLFLPHQIYYQYDNAAFKGVSVRSVTSKLLSKLEADPLVLMIEPVSIYN